MSRLVKEAMARLKKEGRVFGNPSIKKSCQPLGAAAQKESARIFNDNIRKLASDLNKTGDMTIGQILEAFQETGVKTRTGEEWAYHNLYRILADGDRERAPIISGPSIIPQKVIS
jgi:hypothetical protein|tara:strand:- start:85 stop:429 length:345 start_codon:yes stop_codon:yes gene_type:complete